MPKFLGQNTLLICNIISLIIFVIGPKDTDHEHVQIQLALVIYLSLISMLMGYLIWKKDRIRSQMMTNLMKAEFMSTLIFAVGINIWIHKQDNFGDTFFT